MTLRIALCVCAFTLLLLGALVIGVGAGEYPLFSRPGGRFLLFEAGPPLAAGIVALAVWGPWGGEASLWLRIAAGLVLAGLLLRAVERLRAGSPPATVIEGVGVAALLALAVTLEVIAVKNRPG